MPFASTPLIALSLVVMIFGVVASFIPVVPGTILVWGIAMIFAVLDGFVHITVPAVVVMTVLMLISLSHDIWLPLIGIKSSGLSCLGAVGLTVGGLIGTFAIPLPLVGSLLGAVAGALIVEFIKMRQLRGAVKAGTVAAKLFFIGYVIEVGSAIAVFVVYLYSVYSTAG